MSYVSNTAGFGTSATSQDRRSKSAFGAIVLQSLFAPLITNFSSCRRGFRVNMWGTSSPGDKLTGDFGNEPDATSISDRGLFRLLAEICHPAFSDFCNTICQQRTQWPRPIVRSDDGPCDVGPHSALAPQTRSLRRTRERNFGFKRGTSTDRQSCAPVTSFRTP